MADGTFQPKVYHKLGGDSLVVASGGTIQVETGGKVVPNSGTQASNIAAIATASGTFTAGERTKFNSVLTALINVGILATG